MVLDPDSLQVAGSIRSPATNNGIFGLHPATSRIPLIGLSAPQIGPGYSESVLGPLSTSIDGIKLFMKTVLAAKPWVADPRLVPLPWRNREGFLGENGRKGLRVAVLRSGAIVEPHPPTVRALGEVVRKLRKVRGVEDFAWELIVSFGGFHPSTPDSRI